MKDLETIMNSAENNWIYEKIPPYLGDQEL